MISFIAPNAIITFQFALIKNDQLSSAYNTSSGTSPGAIPRVIDSIFYSKFCTMLSLVLNAGPNISSLLQKN